jgi:hypothetical protein
LPRTKKVMNSSTMAKLSSPKSRFTWVSRARSLAKLGVDEVAVVKLLTKFIAISEAVLGAGPYLWAGHGPQSKGVGQWQ